MRLRQALPLILASACMVGLAVGTSALHDREPKGRVDSAAAEDDALPKRKAPESLRRMMASDPHASSHAQAELDVVGETGTRIHGRRMLGFSEGRIYCLGSYDASTEQNPRLTCGPRPDVQQVSVAREVDHDAGAAELFIKAPPNADSLEVSDGVRTEVVQPRRGGSAWRGNFAYIAWPPDRVVTVTAFDRQGAVLGRGTAPGLNGRADGS